MIRAEVNNCNNIISGAICLQNNHLNIRYAMNGIGKSTIFQMLNAFLNLEFRKLCSFEFSTMKLSATPKSTTNLTIPKTALVLYYLAELMVMSLLYILASMIFFGNTYGAFEILNSWARSLQFTIKI